MDSIAYSRQNFILKDNGYMGAQVNPFTQVPPQVVHHWGLFLFCGADARILCIKFYAHVALYFQ
jgi:hypothetical protein